MVPHENEDTLRTTIETLIASIEDGLEGSVDKTDEVETEDWFEAFVELLEE